MRARIATRCDRPPAIRCGQESYPFVGSTYRRAGRFSIKKRQALPDRVVVRDGNRVHRVLIALWAHERGNSYPQQAQAAIERDTFEARARRTPDRFRIGCRRLERDITGQGMKVVIPEFDADRLAEVALAYEISAHPLTEFQQDLGEGLPVESWM